MPWPASIPHDLDDSLSELDNQRASTGNADTWNAMREWLIKHDVASPEGLPTRPEIPSPSVDRE
jgi:hypothetical protein